MPHPWMCLYGIHTHADARVNLVHVVPFLFEPPLIAPSCRSVVQEVDHFDNFYLPMMSRSGYSSVYVKRPGAKQDGCCIFYRPSRSVA